MATLHCPKCRSKDIEAISQPGKKLSISKGLVGGALLGPIGAVAGGAMLGKKGKTTLHCRDCGNVWEKKF